MIRPQLEYASDVWDPHYVGDNMEQEKYNEEQPTGCWMIMADLVQFFNVRSVIMHGQPFKLIVR